MSKWQGRPNSNKRGYGTAWIKIRKSILSRDKWLCQSCKDRGRLTPANEVDHIIRKADGGTDEASNLQSLCALCHRAKTARESHGVTDCGCRPDGTPTDPAHHWS